MLVKCLKHRSICFRTLPGRCARLPRPGSSFFPVPAPLCTPLRFSLRVGSFRRRAPWQVTMGVTSTAALGLRQLLEGARPSLAHLLRSPLGAARLGKGPALGPTTYLWVP